MPTIEECAVLKTDIENIKSDIKDLKELQKYVIRWTSLAIFASNIASHLINNTGVDKIILLLSEFNKLVQ